MKKTRLLLLPIALILGLVGCKQTDTTDKTERSTEPTAISAQQTTTQTQSSQTSASTTFTSVTSEQPQPSAESIVQTTSSSTESTAPSTSEPTDPLANYSNLQIEYARVWLATMGTTYKDWLEDPGFELQVTNQPVGTPVNPYEENSLVFNRETVVLTGLFGYQSLVVYSSNYDGTITKYPVPSHFPGDNGTNEISQSILDQASIIPIPTNNPEDIKQLIEVMVIN
ncbi:hypothetical protein BAU15_09120 [Enterococcus sp. JM4C]|uniref:hypothetical protein n=1 Tax=Candidatus Enterococcus huntleyi TaxID=1857217 RepID=UPI001379E8BD|nr:hypothetical protein [Enterococcus sp. JM4C]KAF1296796.1 hypothetical protein BAU15_09120 [Enterococcus sp. JM4C]